MKNWSALCVTVLCVAVFASLLYSTPTVRAEDDASLAAKLPSGFTLTKATPVGSQGMPRVTKIVLYGVEVRPGAEWRNLSRPPDIWDFCHQQTGEMNMTLSTGTRIVIKPGTAFTFAANTHIPLFANNSKQVASYLCWEFVSVEKLSLKTGVP